MNTYYYVYFDDSLSMKTALRVTFGLYGRDDWRAVFPARQVRNELQNHAVLDLARGGLDLREVEEVEMYPKIVDGVWEKGVWGFIGPDRNAVRFIPYPSSSENKS